MSPRGVSARRYFSISASSASLMSSSRARCPPRTAKLGTTGTGSVMRQNSPHCPSAVSITGGSRYSSPSWYTPRISGTEKSTSSPDRAAVRYAPYFNISFIFSFHKGSAQKCPTEPLFVCFVN